MRMVNPNLRIANPNLWIVNSNFTLWFVTVKVTLRSQHFLSQTSDANEDVVPNLPETNTTVVCIMSVCRPVLLSSSLLSGLFTTCTSYKASLFSRFALLGWSTTPRYGSQTWFHSPPNRLPGFLSPNVLVPPRSTSLSSGFTQFFTKPAKWFTRTASGS